jgi:hypothetical protein
VLACLCLCLNAQCFLYNRYIVHTTQHAVIGIITTIKRTVHNAQRQRGCGCGLNLNLQPKLLACVLWLTITIPPSLQCAVCSVMATAPALTAWAGCLCLCAWMLFLRPPRNLPASQHTSRPPRSTSASQLVHRTARLSRQRYGCRELMQGDSGQPPAQWFERGLIRVAVTTRLILSPVTTCAGITTSIFVWSEHALLIAPRKKILL